MRVLILGKGGREHALGWKIHNSPLNPKLYFLPGNAGTEAIGVNIEGDYNDFAFVFDVVKEFSIDMVIVGPEDPIASGISDFLNEKGVNVIAPFKKVAFLEASKINAKEFMLRNNIPTADFRVFLNYGSAEEFIKQQGTYPIVIKADGLCAGKGVVIAHNEGEALSAVSDFIVKGKFGESSKKVVVEKFLEGYEFSVFAYLDGDSFIILGDAVDYKQAYDGDGGPNTGGMGSVSPSVFISDDMRETVKERIIERTVRALQRENLYYKGFLYFGLMWTDNGPYVLEYNVRMGDPETQALVALDERDWLEMLSGKVLDKAWPVYHKVCVEVVLTSAGYPEKYEKGFIVKGLLDVDNVLLFHAGTNKKGNEIVTDGGRVLNIVSCAETLSKARNKVYKEVRKLSFENMFYRKDIGGKERWKGIL